MGGPRKQSADGAPGKRPPPGRPFAKGVSGNPGGRPKGSKNFSQAIRDACDDDPLALALIAVDIARGKPALGGLTRAATPGEDLKLIPRKVITPSFDHRLEALKFLRDSGWGKPAQKLEVEVSEVEKKAELYSAMTKEELAAAISAALKSAEEQS